MPFFQTPPKLGNQFDDDPTLQAYLARALPREMMTEIRAELRDMGDLSAGELYELSQSDVRAEPKLTHWDPWGHRVDTIEVTPLWKRAATLTAERGVIATAYERKHEHHSRVHQMALLYLFAPSTGYYGCPLAMTDGAAHALLRSKNTKLINRAVGHLTSRDPKLAWTSGQWMTERTGGSDVAISETVAKDNGDGTFGLFGTKWFTSAITSDMALTLGRPEGNPPGGSGLALFYLETRDVEGKLNNIQVNRLKDKLGTRMVPTAELTLDGTRAIPVVGLKDGIKSISPMLTMTRTWNAVAAIADMRRAIALSKAYAKLRVAFGSPLAEKPLHLDTLAGVEAEFMGAFHLALRAVELLGKDECASMSDEESELQRLLTPLAKLTTAKQAVAVVSECLESFGGAGYVEDTGLPTMLRDSQVLPIWEGTTNVLSLDLLRVLAKGGSLLPIEREVRRATEGATPEAKPEAEAARNAVQHASSWLATNIADGPRAVEASARRLALTLGRSLELAFLVEQASSPRDPFKGKRALAAGRRLRHHGIDLIVDTSDSADAAMLFEA